MLSGFYSLQAMEKRVECKKKLTMLKKNENFKK
jgi:hypothetical protein